MDIVAEKLDHERNSCRPGQQWKEFRHLCDDVGPARTVVRGLPVAISHEPVGSGSYALQFVPAQRSADN